MIIDETKSSIVGAENILIVSRALSEFQDRFLVPKFTEEKDWKSKTIGVRYKTPGYIEGEILDKGVILRGGLTMVMKNKL